MYLSHPFVLSWSLHGHTGLLVPFGDAEALAATLLAALQQPARFSSLRQRARQHIQERYALRACLKRQLQLVDAVASP